MMENEKEKTELRHIKISAIINASDEHEPDIKNEQVVGLEPLRGQELENGEYYFIKYQGKKMIRKIYFAENGLMLIRVNPKYPSEYYEFTEDKGKQLVVLAKINIHYKFNK
ncbi:S24 family peptidase [Lactococcus allomyrinae]|uniref:Peptidase S24/S26A/S26B/S26C domain-containing protein n=1 Tax=Lactococcus allomyrinae TaxID=2419773 RepID=A0A387BBS3_9LACT|nr:S24 family peptidase [Lactococcus allomyrinae]AYF99877.1 hypothetical protein D7I46_01520 [Lactococcus allomyrinae]